jgi:hypothetical protein
MICTRYANIKAILIWSCLVLLQSSLVKGGNTVIYDADDPSDDPPAAAQITEAAMPAAPLLGDPPITTSCDKCNGTTASSICSLRTTYVKSGSMVRPAVTMPQLDTLIECHDPNSVTHTTICTPPGA